MKLLGNVRGSWILPFVALVGFAPSGIAQTNNSLTNTRAVGVFTFAHDVVGDNNLSETGRGKVKKPRERCKDEHPCQASVPEGGTAGMYLLLSGIFCCGAILSRSRRNA